MELKEGYEHLQPLVDAGLFKHFKFDFAPDMIYLLSGQKHWYYNDVDMVFASKNIISPIHCYYHTDDEEVKEKAKDFMKLVKDVMEGGVE